MQRPAQRGDGDVDRRADHFLELAAGQPDLGLQPGQQHRDGGLGVRGQGFLGGDALVAQPDRGAGGLRISRVQAGDRAVQRPVDVAEHGLVEVHAAEPLDAFRAPQDVKTVLGGPQHGRVEGPPAQVVDRDQRAGVEVIGAGVMRRGSLRLGQHPHLTQPGQRGNLGEQLPLVRPPARRVSQRDRPGPAPLTAADQPGDGAQLVGEQRGRRVRHPAEDHRHRVTEPPLDRPGHPVRLRPGPPLGRPAGQHRAISPGQHHRRNRISVITQSDHFHPAVPRNRSRRERGPQIHTQPVTHQNPSPRPRNRRAGRGAERPARRALHRDRAAREMPRRHSPANWLRRPIAQPCEAADGTVVVTCSEARAGLQIHGTVLQTRPHKAVSDSGSRMGAAERHQVRPVTQYATAREGRVAPSRLVGGQQSLVSMCRA